MEQVINKGSSSLSSLTVSRSRSAPMTTSSNEARLPSIDSPSVVQQSRSLMERRAAHNISVDLSKLGAEQLTDGIAAFSACSGGEMNPIAEELMGQLQLAGDVKLTRAKDKVFYVCVNGNKKLS